MFNYKNHNQQQLFDQWENFSPKRLEMLEQSWAGLFQQEILPVLPVEKFASNFSEDMGRPTKELNTCLGVALFQQIFDLTDKEAQEQLAFNQQWHYALGIPEESDDLKYISLKTIWTTRKLIIKDDLEKDIFKAVGNKLAEVFDVDTEKQRIDSVHIESNMKSLGRIGIIVETNKKFVRNLRRHHKDLLDKLDNEIVEKYIPNQSEDVFSQVKPSDSSKTLKEVCEDLLYFIESFSTNSEIKRMNSYKLMVRVLDEQCNLVERDDGIELEVKDPKEIPSDSVQNPSDTDAGYDPHKGQGYLAQIMETYSDDDTETESGDDKENSDSSEKNDLDAGGRDSEGEPDNNKNRLEFHGDTEELNLITYVEVNPANIHDSQTILPAIKDTDKRNLRPGKILADSLYGSDENLQKAKEEDVDIFSPLGGRPKDDEESIELSDCSFDSDNRLIECPEGNNPEKYKEENKRYTACMNKETCSNCPKEAICPVESGKKYYYFRYDEKELRVSQRRKYEQSDEFREEYRYRAGSEATMSEFDRKTGGKKLRVRGLAKVTYSVIMKITGINIFRAARIWKKQLKSGLICG